MKKNNKTQTGSSLKIRSLLLRSSVLALAVGSFTTSAQALIIRHDKPTLSYENYGKKWRFNSSCAIMRFENQEHGISNSAAIDRSWGVSARHTLRNVENWMNAGNSAVIRGTKWTGVNDQGLGVRTIKSITHFDDDFTQFANVIDIALSENYNNNSALIIGIIGSSWSEQGRTGSGVSHANNRRDGNGNSRKDENLATSNSSRAWEVRWGGRNRIDGVSGNSHNGSPTSALLSTDFDHPTNASFNTLGTASANALEFGFASGDSGSPLHYNKGKKKGIIGGILSGGTGANYSGKTSYVRIRSYRTWILDTMN